MTHHEHAECAFRIEITSHAGTYALQKFTGEYGSCEPMVEPFRDLNYLIPRLFQIGKDNPMMGIANTLRDHPILKHGFYSFADIAAIVHVEQIDVNYKPTIPCP